MSGCYLFYQSRKTDTRGELLTGDQAWTRPIPHGELPALLHLQGEHVLVPVTPGFIAAQIVAGAEKAEIDDRHLPAGETASSPRSEDAFVEHLPTVVETDPPLSVVEVGQKLEIASTSCRERGGQ